MLVYGELDIRERHDEQFHMSRVSGEFVAKVYDLVARLVRSVRRRGEVHREQFHAALSHEVGGGGGIYPAG